MPRSSLHKALWDSAAGESQRAVWQAELMVPTLRWGEEKDIYGDDIVFLQNSKVKWIDSNSGCSVKDIC